jgi:short-chain 2-methylacyl-CoA dehydrogenase
MSYCFKESEEISILRSSIRSFAQKEIAPLAFELDKGEKFSYNLTHKMGEIGLFGCVVDCKYSGQGMDYLPYVICIEELARVDSSQAATIAAHNSLGAAPIYYYGSEKQKEHLLPQLCDGSGLWSFGLTEANAGSDARASETIAKQTPDKKGWILNGSKIWITNAATEISKGITIQAVSGREDKNKPELTCFLVPLGSPGLSVITMKDKMMWRASNTAEVVIEDVFVPNDMVLGKKGDGFSIMMETLDSGRLSIAAMGLGLAKGAYSLSLKYAKERKTFGKYLKDHQVIAFKFADMATRIEAAENLLYKACWMRQQGMAFETHASMAKLYCSEVAEFCAREGQQIFGGYGLMKEYPIERHYRDAALLRIGEGTNEIQKMVISRSIFS